MQKKMVILVLFLGIMFFFTNEISNFLITLKQEKENIYNENKRIYQTLVSAEHETLSSIALLLSRDTKVQEAYLQKDPRIIQKNFVGFWQKMTQEQMLNEIHFFTNESNTFIDFNHNPDKTLATRCDISWSIENVANSFHSLVCSNYVGLRATYPIISTKGVVLGGLSVGKEIGSFPFKMKKITSLDTFLVYSKEAAKVLTNSSYKTFIHNKKIVGKYILAEHTFPFIASQISSIDFSKKTQTFKIESQKYFLNIIQIKDFQNKNIAYLCTLNSMDKLYNAFYKTMLKNLFLIIAGSLLLYMTLKGKITRIKQEISKIKNIADNLKEKNFKVLEQVDMKELENTDDEIKNLLVNIIQMGKSLQVLTENLEEKVRISVEKVTQSHKIMLHQSKLASMGEMVDAIAHQWKQPISIVKMKIDMLEYDMQDNHIDKEYINIYKKTSLEQLNHMVNTLDEFRGFLRPDKAVETFYIKDALDSVLHLLKDDIVSHMIQIEVDCPKEIQISAIKNEFKHVLINLINNAKDAFRDNGIITKKIIISVRESKDTIMIQVLDNAGGIPQNIIDNIFEANFTTKGANGTGIGLYLSKLIIEKFAGTIGVKNTLDGACFELKFSKR